MLHIAFFRRSSASSWQALVGAICFAQAAAIVGFDFTLPFIPLYLQHNLGVHGLAQTALWAGLIGFGPAIPATIFGPLWGRVADRFGYRTMLLRAMLSASLLLALMGLAPSPGILLGLRMVQGALTGTTFAAQALVAATVPEKETGRAMGLLQMSVFAGATLGPLGGGAVADLLGYRATYAVAGGLLALATMIVVAFVHEPKRKFASGTAEARASRPSLLSVLAIPAFASALILTLTVQLASTAQFPVIPLYVKDLLHSSQNVASDTGWLLAAGGLVAGAGSYVAGRLQRRIGLKRLLAVSVLLSSLLFLPQAVVENYVSFLIVRCIAAFAFGGMLSMVGTLAAVSSPANAKGTAFGLMGAASSIGFGVGPLIGGSLVAVVGIRSIFVLSAITLGLVPAVVAGLSAAPRVRRTLRTGPRAVLRLLPERQR